MSDQQRERVQAQFGPSAEAYVTSPGHAGGPDLDRLVLWGRRRAPARVLDLATGGGHTALAFAAFTPTVVATDLTLPMLRAAQKFLLAQGATGVRFLAADVEALPFPDAAFDLVTCRIAAHHFPAVEPALGEAARVLAAGGALLLQDILGHEDPEAAAFMLEVERRRDPSHVRAYGEGEWRAFLGRAGLRLVDQAVVPKVRGWEEWTGRMRMAPEARAALDRFVLGAPARCREAFTFQVEAGRVLSFTDRMLLLRADKG